jgi:nickel/cobalt transporter (NicO) family protein
MPRWAASLWLRLSLLCLITILGILVLLPFKEAEAHPLGNFTINHYSRLEFVDETVRITYVLDLAEIPTFQQMDRLDADGDAKLSEAEAAAYLDAELPALLEGLHLEVGEEALPLRVLSRSAAFVPGQGGLPTLRIEAKLLADLPEDWEEHGAGYYTDRNYEDRLGWREIVIKGGPGISIKRSTAPTADVSNELRSYPQDMLSSPLDHRKASFTLVSGNGIAAGDTAGRAAESVRTGNKGGATDRVASLISTGRLSPAVIVISMLAALLWGAAHALTPGHGKAVVAAYLIGARGTVRHAALLGLTVTLTHTAGVFALGAVTLYLSRYVLPEALYPWLNVVSGLLVVAIGCSLLYRRSRGLFRTGIAGEQHTHPHHGVHEHSHTRAPSAHAHYSSYGDHHHPHRSGHTHSHHDGHTHSHLPPGADGSKVSLGSLLAVGVSGGLVPCPAALVLLLSAISLGRLGFGMVLVVAFSVGLAIVLSGIGILMIYAKGLFERFSFEARVPRVLPVASALAISLAGVVILLGSLKQAGIV